MLPALQQFTSFVNRRKYKFLPIGDKNMWYGGGLCGSQSLWCLPLSSPPYILDNLPCSLVCLASKPQRSTCLPQHYDPSISRISAPGAPSTSCARPRASEGAGGSGSWELSWVCVPRRERWRPHCCYCCYTHSCQQTALFPCRDYLSRVGDLGGEVGGVSHRIGKGGDKHVWRAKVTWVTVAIPQLKQPQFLPPEKPC